MMKKTVIALSAIIFGSTLAAHSIAEQPGQQPPQQPPAAAQPAMPDASSISDGDIKRFAAVQDQVMEIQKEVNQELQAKQGDPQAAMDVQQNAQQKMIGVVQDNGLEVATYNQIVQLIQADPDFRERVQEKL